MRPINKSVPYRYRRLSVRAIGMLAGEGRRFGYGVAAHAKAEGDETRESETFSGIRIGSGA